MRRLGVRRYVMIRGMAEETQVCDYCGAPLPDDALWIEVQRVDVSADRPADYQGIAFCGQEHAGAFFTERRLPPAEFGEWISSPAFTWWERVGCAAAIVWAIAQFIVATVGVITIRRWIWP